MESENSDQAISSDDGKESDSKVDSQKKNKSKRSKHKKDRGHRSKVEDGSNSSGGSSVDTESDDDRRHTKKKKKEKKKKKKKKHKRKKEKKKDKHRDEPSEEGQIEMNDNHHQVHNKRESMIELLLHSPSPQESDTAAWEDEDNHQDESGAESTELLLQYLPYFGQGDPSTDEVVQQLLEGLSKDHINQERDENGNTLLILACQYQTCHPLVAQLIALEAEVQALNQEGACALHYVCYKESFSAELVQLLVEAGSQVEVVETTYGCTPLHYAAGTGDAKVCQLLLSKGARPDTQDYYHYSALDYAKQSNNQECIELIKDAMAKGSTPQQKKGSSIVMGGNVLHTPGQLIYESSDDDFSPKKGENGHSLLARTERSNTNEFTMSGNFSSRMKSPKPQNGMAMRKTGRFGNTAQFGRSMQFGKTTINQKTINSMGATLAGDWQSYMDWDSGKVYFLNQVTQASVWEDELTEEAEQLRTNPEHQPSTELKNFLKYHAYRARIASFFARSDPWRIVELDAMLQENKGDWDRILEKLSKEFNSVKADELKPLPADYMQVFRKKQPLVTSSKVYRKGGANHLHTSLHRTRMVSLGSPLGGVKTNALGNTLSLTLSPNKPDLIKSPAPAVTAEPKVAKKDLTMSLKVDFAKAEINPAAPSSIQKDGFKAGSPLAESAGKLTLTTPGLQSRGSASLLSSTLGNTMSMGATPLARSRPTTAMGKQKLVNVRRFGAKLSPFEQMLQEHYIAKEIKAMEASHAQQISDIEEANHANEAERESQEAKLKAQVDGLLKDAERLRKLNQSTSEELDQMEHKFNEEEKRVLKEEELRNGEIAELRSELSVQQQKTQKMEDSLSDFKQKEGAKLEAERKEAEEFEHLQSLKMKQAQEENNSEKNRRETEYRQLNQRCSKELKDLSERLENQIQKLRHEIRTTQQKGAEDTSRAQSEAEAAARRALAAQQQTEALEKEVASVQKEIADAEEQRQLMESLTGLLNSQAEMRKKLHNKIEDLKGKIRVYVRVRPLSKKELKNKCANVATKEGAHTIKIQDKDHEAKHWDFDQVFAGNAEPPDGNSQEGIFRDTKYLITSTVDGYNVCIFAYGQTGSGKTFTMFGPGGAGDGVSASGQVDTLAGLTPRCVVELFRILKEREAQYEFDIKVSMYELYRDALVDLLAPIPKSGKQNLRIKLAEHTGSGLVHVEGGQERQANTLEAVLDVIKEGAAHRATSSTQMNADSSRSHLVCSLVVRSKNRRRGTKILGKLTLVDLAGSERVGRSGAKGDQLKEAQSINKSLSALGDVIGALTSGSKHIPYRNHPLTMLMSDSLGGNAKTLMFVCASPADYNAGETGNALNFAARCKDVTNSVGGGAAAQQAQIQALRRQLEKMGAKKNAPARLARPT